MYFNLIFNLNYTFFPTNVILDDIIASMLAIYFLPLNASAIRPFTGALNQNFFKITSAVIELLSNYDHYRNIPIVFYICMCVCSGYTYIYIE